MIRELLLSGLFAVAVPGLAQAHATLASSQPADGVVLTEAPATVHLEFNADVRMVSLLLKRQGAADISLIAEPSAVAQRNVSASLPKLAPGSYVVEWRAAAKDMHAMSGGIHFSVGEAPSSGH